MSVNLTVNNSTFAYPTDGQEPGWGGPATDFAIEVATVLASLLGPDDIPETTFTVANNQSSSQDVSGLVFNTTTVRSASIDYSIYITSSSTELAERGQLYLIYKNSASTGTKWSIGRVIFGDDAGINFTMTDAGQVQYTSSNVGGTSYTGTMKFEAKVTNQ